MGTDLLGRVRPFLLFGRGGGEVVGGFTTEKADYAGYGVWRW